MILEQASALLLWALAFIQANPIVIPSIALVALNYLVLWSWARKVRKQLGVLPEYVKWLEAKAELYEGALQLYADPGNYEAGEDGKPYVLVDAGGAAARTLLKFKPDQHQAQ